MLDVKCKKRCKHRCRCIVRYGRDGPTGPTGPSNSASAIGPALQSIDNLTTTSDEIIYTVATNVYNTSPITPQGRQLLQSANMNAAQSVLGTVVGTDVQSHSTALDAFAAISGGASSDELIYSSGPNTFSVAQITPYARTILDDANATSARSTLGLGTIAVLPSPTGDVVGTVDAQTLTNKDISDASNTIRATQLGTSSADVVIDSSLPPTSGDVLIATSSTSASWQPISSDVSGPNSSLDNELARFDGVSGKIIQSGTSVVLDDSSNISGVNNLTANTLSGTLLTAAQPVITSVGTLNGLVMDGNIVMGLGDTVDGVDVGSLSPITASLASEIGAMTPSEFQQIQNIDSSTISPSQWAYVGEMDQSVNTSSSPGFSGLTVSGVANLNGGASVPSSESLSIADPPSLSTDATNKAYVDAVVASGAPPLQSVNAASTVTISGTYNSGSETIVETLNTGLLTIDTVVTGVLDGNRYLIKNQSNDMENGVYIRIADDPGPKWVLQRTSDFDMSTGIISAGTTIFVSGGSTNLNTSWALQSSVTITNPLTDSIVFVQTSGSQNIAAGAGLVQIGNNFNVASADATMQINADSIQVSPTYSGNSSLTTVGTISSGIWNGSIISILYGGTNASNAADARSNLGLEIGSDVQNYNPSLQSISGLVTAADQMIYTTGPDTFSVTQITPYARTILDDVDAASVRSTLGLGSIAILSAPTGDVVGTVDAQTLTNKTLVDSSTYISDNSDPTKQFQFQASTISPATTRVYNVPDEDTTLVGTTTNQSLTNKDISDPSNIIRATQLGTTVDDVIVSTSSPPSAGQVLTTIDPTTANWQNITAQPPSVERRVTVAQSGGDYTSVQDAISDVNSGVILGGIPTSSNPVTIQISPGTYSETNPIIVPSYVTLESSTSTTYSNAVIITPTTSINTAIIQLSSFSNVGGILVSGANGVGGIGFSAPAGTLQVNIAKCTVEDCETGYLISGSGVEFSTIVFMDQCIARATSTAGLSIGFRVTGGALLRGSDCSVFSQTPIIPVGVGFQVDGATTQLSLNSIRTQSCETSVLCQNGGVGSEALIRITSGQIDSSLISAVEVGPNAIVESYGVTISSTNTGGMDVRLTASTSTFIGAGNEIRDDLIENVSDGKFIGTFISNAPGETSFDVRGELHVGSVESPAEAAFGGGDSHVSGMTVFTFDGLITYNNITADVSLVDDGLSANAFADTSSGNILYVGGEIIQFTGIKITITSGIVPSGGGGDVISEYWNGVGWTAFNLMSTDSNAPYIPHAKNMFDLGSYQYRFGKREGWTQTMVNGVNAYWVRFRLINNITTIPVIDQIKLGTNRTEINEDGFMEYFGTAETQSRNPFDVNLLRASNDSPANQDLYLQDTISVGRVENNFLSGVIDRSGFMMELPEEIDTSHPLKLRFRFRLSSSSGGNIDVVIRWGYCIDILDDPSPVGTSLSSVFPSTATAPTTAPGFLGAISQSLIIPPDIQNRVLTQDFELDVSDMVAHRSTGSLTGDLLWVSFERTGSVDTYPGNASLIQITPYYTKWCEGAYIG